MYERLNLPFRTHIRGIPSRFDVLFGKGTPYQTHPGNVKFRAFILDCQVTYEAAERGKKQHVAQEIVDTIRQSSGRFLKLAVDGGSCWVDVGDEQARIKVSNSFRTLRIEQRKNK